MIILIMCFIVSIWAYLGILRKIMMHPNAAILIVVIRSKIRSAKMVTTGYLQTYSAQRRIFSTTFVSKIDML